MLRVLALLAAASAACSSDARCGDVGTVHLAFGPPYPFPYQGGLTVGPRSVALSCPTDTVIDGWRVVCQADGIRVSGPGMKIEAASFAVINLIDRDGATLLQNRPVTLGPVFRPAPDSDVCERDGIVNVPLVPLQPVLVVDPKQANFDATPIGTTTAPFPFTITNRGGTVSGVPYGAVTGGDFTIGRASCSDGLPPLGGSCTLGVIFRPTAAGPRSGTLTVRSTPGGTVSVPLAGEGQAAVADAAAGD